MGIEREEGVMTGYLAGTVDGKQCSLRGGEHQKRVRCGGRRWLQLFSTG